MKYVYIVYVEDAIPAMGVYSICSMAFVPDENPDGFALVANHYSSNMDWAKSDIRNDGHQEELKNVFPDGFEYVDVNDVPLPTKHCKEDVISMLKDKKNEMEEERNGMNELDDKNLVDILDSQLSKVTFDNPDVLSLCLVCQSLRNLCVSQEEVIQELDNRLRSIENDFEIFKGRVENVCNL